MAADWRAPVSRNASEVAGFRWAVLAVPNAVPTILAHDAVQGFFAMDFLPPATFPCGIANSRQDAPTCLCCKVGANLVMIHADTAGQSAIASDFNDDALFRAIRSNPIWSSQRPGIR